MCEKMSIGNMLNGYGNSYKLVFIHREILYEYIQITSPDHDTTTSGSSSSSSTTSRRSSSESNGDDDDIPNTVFIDTSDITHEEPELRTISTESSSSSSSSRHSQDDDSDERERHHRHHHHIWKRHSNEDSSDSDSSSSSDSFTHISRHRGHNHNNHHHHHNDDDDDNYSKFVKPGTKGLSCTCEIEGEQPIYDADPLARCTIEHVEQVIHSKEHHFNRTLSAIWRSLLILFVLIFAIVICIIACAVCFSPKRVENRYESLIPVYHKSTTKKTKTSSVTKKKPTSEHSDNDLDY